MPQGGGSAYVRHRDRSPSSPHRTVTVLCYLNPDWTQKDGGQLRLFGPGGGSVDVDPLGGRVVVFESGMEHEVLPAHARRFAITVWFSEGGRAEVQSGGGVCSERPLNGQEAGKGEQRSTASSAQPEPPAVQRGSVSITKRPLDSPSLQPPSAAQAPDFSCSLPTPPVTSPPGTPPSGQRIFVSIACFRDSECRWTVKDLFRTADAPDRVSVGVVWQIDEQEDGEFAHLRGLDTAVRERVREVRVDWREASGPCWARHRAQQLLGGEDYFLQVTEMQPPCAATMASGVESPKGVFAEDDGEEATRKNGITSEREFP